MIGKYRSVYDILVNVLEQMSKKTVSSTEVFYGTKSSWKVAKNGLQLAIQYKLAQKLPKSSDYIITTKGAAFLEAWSNVQQFLTEKG